MRLPRLTDAAYRPLLIRAAVLMACALVSLLPSLIGTVSQPLTPGQIALPVVLLLLVAAIGTVPLPGPVPLWLQPLAETLAAALVVGSLRGTADQFLVYLLVPLTVSGLTAGLAASLTCAVVAGTVLEATAWLQQQQPLTSGRVARPSVADPTTWAVILVAVAGVSAWARRVVVPPPDVRDAAYEDAHRLLSELHVVARQLSLGLDPQTLAAALMDELSELSPGSTGSVLVRSAGGRFVPLVGDLPSPTGESVVLDAWLASDVIKRAKDDTTVTGLPVRMGERVVAVVVLNSAGAQTLPLDDVRAAVNRSGPRLASALLFDDVRRLATVDERMRLAREIHDGIAQDVASLGYIVDDIAADAEPTVAARLATLRESLATMVGDLRMSIFDLRAGVDESVSLARALADYAQRVAHQVGLAVHFSADESPQRLPVSVEIELLRMVQEAVTNVRRHAQATNLWLTVTVDPPRAHVRIEDDGLGLQQPRADSMGLTGMRERAERIGARLDVRAREQGRGTRVDIRLEADRPPGFLDLHHERDERDQLEQDHDDQVREVDLTEVGVGGGTPAFVADSAAESRRLPSVRDAVGLGRSTGRRSKDRTPRREDE